MRKYLTNKIHMYRSVKRSCEQHQNSWEGMPAFVEGYQAFLEGLSHLLILGLEYDSLDVKVAGDVDVRKAVAAEKTLKISRALQSLAHRTEDSALYRKSHVTGSSLRRAKRDTALNFFSKILNLGTGHLAALADYGIVQADLDELTVLRDAYAAAINDPQRARVERKTLNKELQLVARQIDRILDFQLDKLVKVIGDHAFIADYDASRIVIDYGTRHREGNDDEKGVQPPERDSGTVEG